MVFMPEDSPLLIDKDKVPDDTSTERLLSEKEMKAIYECNSTPCVKCISECDKMCYAQDAKTAAARDKWWVEQIERYEAMLNRNLDSHSIIIPWASWQSLKQSLEVKE